MPPVPGLWSPTSLDRGGVVALAVGPDVALAAFDDERAPRLHRSTDGGETWAAGDAGLPRGALMAALAVRGARALAGTFGDGLFGSTDGGQTWRGVGGGLPASASVLVFAVHGRALWAGTRAHGVFRSADGGRTWVSASAGLPWDGRGLEVFSLGPTPAGVVAGHPFGLHRSSDGGRTWDPLGLGSARGPALGLVATAGGVLVAGLDGHLARSPDGGRTWATGTDGLRGLPLAAVGPVLFAATAAGLARSDDGGRTWHAFAEGLPSNAVPDRVAAAGRFLLAGTVAHGLWRRAWRGMRPTGARPAREATPVLEESRPNPFTDETTLAFDLPRAAEVVLAVDDGNGAEIARLDEGAREPGRHTVPFQSARLPVGLYTARLDVEGQRWRRLMLRL